MNGNFDKFVYSQGFILINTKNIYFFAKEKRYFIIVFVSVLSPTSLISESFK